MSAKNEIQKMYFSNIILGLLLSLFSFTALANAEGLAPEAKHAEAAASETEEKFDAGKLILHHVADEHEWHFFTVGHFHATLPLPCIVYRESTGFQVFMSSAFKNEHHEEIPYQGLKLEHGKIHAENGEKVIDISITKNVASLLLSAVLLLSIFIGIGNTYKANPHKAPKGIQ